MPQEFRFHHVDSHTDRETGERTNTDSRLIDGVRVWREQILVPRPEAPWGEWPWTVKHEAYWIGEREGAGAGPRCRTIEQAMAATLQHA